MGKDTHAVLRSGAIKERTTSSIGLTVPTRCAPSEQWIVQFGQISILPPRVFDVLSPQVGLAGAKLDILYHILSKIANVLL